MSPFASATMSRLDAAAVRAAHPGNDAKAARMIAAFGNFQIGEMSRRQPKTRRLEIRDEGRARNGRPAAARIEAWGIEWLVGR